MISKTPSWKHPYNQNVSLKILNIISKNAKFKNNIYYILPALNESQNIEII